LVSKEQRYTVDEQFSSLEAADEGNELARQTRLYEAATMKDLKQICRDRHLKGFSTFNRAALINLLVAEDAQGLSPTLPVVISEAPEATTSIPEPVILGQYGWEIAHPVEARVEEIECRKV